MNTFESENADGSVGVEYLTMLSGAKILFKKGLLSQAESIFQQAYSLAQEHGNELEKQTVGDSLADFLQRSKAKEASVEDLPLLPMQKLAQYIIAIGSSAGGVEALSLILAGLPTDLNACVLVVHQTPGHSPSDLVKALNERSTLAVLIPVDGAPLLTGVVYLAPPNKHLIVKRDRIVLGNGPKENRARPAIDVLFRTAAHAYGAHVLGVILSGVLNDGTAGLMSIEAHGGRSIVQDPDEAVFDGMPRSAIAFTDVDYIMSAAKIGPFIGKFVAKTLQELGEIPPVQDFHDDRDVGQFGGPGIGNVAPYPPSALTCPACGGAVWEIQQRSLTLFKCHVGHSYTAELMLEEQSETVDAAAWALLRAIDESIHLRKKLAEFARLSGRTEEAEFHDLQASQAIKQSATFRSLILSSEKGRD